jgi:hypothetical protein
MKPDQSIQIQLETTSGMPLALDNALLEIRLFTHGNFRYCFKAGRTDSKGQLRISYSDLESVRALNAKQFLMDYNTPIEDCDPTVELRVPSEKELRDASDKVCKSYGKPPDWATHWPSNGQVEAQPRMVNLADTVTRVSISIVVPQRAAI